MQRISDSIESEFIGIVNYGIIALIQDAAADDANIEWTAQDADNATTRAMVATLKQTLLKAVAIHQTQPAVFAALTREVLQIQLRRSWEINYGGMFSHIAAATVRRPIGSG